VQVTSARWRPTALDKNMIRSSGNVWSSWWNYAASRRASSMVSFTVYGRSLMLLCESVNGRKPTYVCELMTVSKVPSQNIPVEL